MWYKFIYGKKNFVKIVLQNNMNIIIPTFVFKNNNDYLDNEYRCILDLMVDTEIRKITVKNLTEKKNYAARIPER